jgi:hypothetical protein
VIVQLRLTPEQKAVWREAAGREDLSPWIRHVVDSHIIRSLEIPRASEATPAPVIDDLAVDGPPAAAGQGAAEPGVATPAPGSSECRSASSHWRLRVGEACPDCGLRP